MTDRIGHYRIDRKIGEGGMGVVYAGYDERLARAVAIKTIRAESTEPKLRERLLREARTAASISHPNICQLFDIGEDRGEPFLVMELLDGMSVADRLRDGPIAIVDVVQTALGILMALVALHRKGLVHRDLKPSNVFLSSQGVKLLDFGLAREFAMPTAADAPTAQMTAEPLTIPGAVVGTPRYMSPEQLSGSPVDPRSDLFSLGAILFEMASGRPAFDGDSIAKLFHAIVYEQPPALAGSAAIVALDRAIHRAMAKQPNDRYESADAMANELRSLLMLSDAAVPAVARPMTRLIVLPFRFLRADPEIDFLSEALAESITSSLAGLESLIVRSSIAAAGYAAGERVDLHRVASEANVDIVLTGTILRAGDRLRVTTQLVEAPGGTLVWSLTSELAMHDIFKLQDELTHRIVDSLHLPLTDREQRMLRRDVPANPRAHEFYLRAMQQANHPEHWTIARDLYLRSLEDDPAYAPAWARLGRIYFLLGKYTAAPEDNFALAEAALERALEMNPDLAIAHHAYTKLEVALGRPMDAMIRLLDRAQRSASDPELFAALVMAARFCGLLGASVAAHERAVRLDPKILTSVAHTYWALGEFEKALADDEIPGYVKPLAFVSLGREAEALAFIREKLTLKSYAEPKIRAWPASLGAILEWNHAEAERQLEILATTFRDPEGFYLIARAFAKIGALDRAMQMLTRAVDEGFCCFPSYVADPWLDPLRARPDFLALLHRCEARHREARAAFAAHEGPRILGVE